MTDITQVEISRRNFIKGMLGLAVAMSIPGLPTIDELQPVTSTKDIPLSKDEILEWIVDDSVEEKITIKQPDNYIGTIRIDDKTYPILSVDIAWRQKGAILMGYEYPLEISIDFQTDTIILPPEFGIVEVELSVINARLAMKGKGYFTERTGFQMLDDFYMWNCGVQLISEPEFVF